MKSVPMALVVSVTLSLMCNLMCGQQPGGVFCPSDADCPASMVCRLDLNECVELSTAKALVCEVEESDCNPYVRDVPNAVTRMRQNGEIMGFHQSNYPDFDCGVSCPHHWQGLQRLTHADGRYFAISSNGEQSTDGAKIGIIHFPSREEEQTGRLRSNRLAYGLNSWEVAPHENDKIINWQTLSTTLEHSGGMQVLGKYLFVALENAKNQEPASIAVVDVENPDIPTLLRFIELESNEAAAVAVIKLADGSFMMAVAQNYSYEIDIYLSQTEASVETAAFTKLDTAIDNTGDNCLNGYCYFQNLDFVADEYGNIYLFGTGPNDGINAEDHLAAYNIYLKEGGSVDAKFEPTLRKTIFCATDEEGYQCDTLAAGGVYITPDHNMYLYVSEHDNDGDVDGVYFVRMREFSPVPVIGEHRCDDINDAFVELFEDADFQGRSVILDYEDSVLRDLSNFEVVENMHDNVSSVRWCLPTGWYFRAFENINWEGGSIEFAGEGVMKEIRDLVTCILDNTYESAGDKLDSGMWISVEEP